METNQTLAENVVETPSTPEVATQVNDVAPEQVEQVNNTTVETEPQENADEGKYYTKERIEELMKKRVEQSHRSFFKRYGVENLKELDDLFCNGNTLQDEVNELRTKNEELTRDIAFIRNNILPERYDDVMAHFKGSNIEFNEEQLVNLIKTHPEWVKPQVKQVGAEAHPKPQLDEKQIASKILGVNL